MKQASVSSADQGGGKRRSAAIARLRPQSSSASRRTAGAAGLATIIGWWLAIISPGDDGVMAFTDFGIETLTGLIEIYKADPDLLTRCGLRRTLIAIQHIYE
jgi:hypothetical protein